MARIGIDATTVVPIGKGISRSVRLLVRALAAAEPPHELQAYVRSEEAGRLLSGVVPYTVVSAAPTLLWEQVGIPRAFRRDRLDLLLTTTERLPPSRAGQCVVWLYELPGHRIEQNRRSSAPPYQRASDAVTAALWRPSLRRSRRIAAGSHATAEQLLEALPLLAGRVDVVYPAVDPVFVPPHMPRREHLLAITSSDPRDNTEALIEALPHVPCAPRLLVAGDPGARRAILEQAVARLGLAGRIEFLGRVSEDRLADLFGGALAYLDASLFEGFGYQVLEAMSAGTPVIASGVTSIPEIVGDAGILCDPRVPAEFAAAVQRVLREPGLAERLERAGRERAGSFTWGGTAEAMLKTLERALSA